jgi:tetratricopeptide (TPR) repeat protein
MKSVFLFALIIFSSVCFSQSTDEKLAAQFFENQEFEKASEMYKKLYKENYTSIYIYENYLQTLIALKDLKTAEKMVEKAIKQNPKRGNYEVDLGYLYLRLGEKEQAQKYLEKIIKEYLADKNQVILIANALTNRQLNEYAVAAYEQGTKKFGVLTFYAQMLSQYRVMGNTTALTDFSLEVLSAEQNAFDYIIRVLDVVYENPKSVEYLQQRTLLYAQKNPSNPVYDELLLEIFLQQKKYMAAMRQVISLDKRNETKGYRVMGFAKLCEQNREYSTALRAYEYVINLGKEGPNYLAAEQGLINSLYLKTTHSINPDKLEVGELIQTIEGFVSLNGVSFKTANSLFRLAELQIFYNHNPTDGSAILEKIIATPRLQIRFLAECKLLLGDAYLMLNNVWDAKLMYGQVDKEFMEDELGQEAKFKNAKLSYYQGDFEWAASQLDILKTATTQLISNNAIELSLLIQDNTGLDSTANAMKEYASAEFLLYQNQIEKCTQILNMLPFKYPNHTLNDEIYFLKAKVQEKVGNFEEANKLYTTVYEKYGDDILADNALYRSANITLYIFNDAQKAQTLFEKVILNYNSSLFVVDARKMYFGLKEGLTKEDLFRDEFLN